MSGATVQSFETMPRSSRRRRTTASLIVLALIASLLALVAPGAVDPASAADVTTNTSFPTDCIGRASGFAQNEPNQMSFAVTAPDSAAPGSDITIRIAPQGSSFPDTNPSPLGQVPVNHLQNIQFMYNLPTNATINSVEIVPGSGSGLEGTPSVAVNTTDHAEHRIILFVPKVPKNPVPPENRTHFQLPAVDINVTVTGAIGGNVTTRVAGHNEATSGYVFEAQSVALANVRCWPVGQVAAPIMSQTAITSGSTTVDTATTLTVDPTLLPAGNDVTLTANVNAPSGAVRFNDGATVLGFDQLNESGTATLTAPLNTIGNRSITATYLGASGFNTSTSAPVAVTVTDPATRAPVRVGVATTPITTTGATATSPVTVNVTVDPITPSSTSATGQVRLYRNGDLVASQALSGSGGAASVSIVNSAPPGGHIYRADYIGDTNYFPGSGTTPHLFMSTVNNQTRPLTGTVTMNGGTGPLATASLLRTTFATDEHGVEALDGQLSLNHQTGVNPPALTTLTVAGGTLTGRLAMVGVGVGAIQPGSDADASYDTALAFQVTSADLGSGVQDLGSSCILGPFDVELTGTRLGTNGLVTLTDSGFDVDAVPSGGCRTTTGTSLAGSINSRIVGDNTSLSLTFTPPAAAPATVVTSVVASSPTSSFAQPITLTAIVERVDGGNLPNGAAGRMEFFADGIFVGAGGVSGPSPTAKPASITLPNQSTAPTTPQLEPLPVGEREITAKYVALPTVSPLMATSTMSAPMTHTVLPAVDREPVSLVLDAPDVVPAAQSAMLTVTMDPAPNGGEGFTPLHGTIQIRDLAEPNITRQLVRTLPAGGARNGIDVVPTDDAEFVVEIALAPGEHELQATFLPDLNALWGWQEAESNVADHTVVGDRIPTTLSIVSETTSGSGKVAQGTALTVRANVSPPTNRVPFVSGGGVYYTFDGGPVQSAPNAHSNFGPASFSIPATAHAAPGSHTLRVWYDPFFISTQALVNPAFPGSVANLGFAVSDQVQFDYEVVAPTPESPMATGIVVDSIMPTGSAQTGIAMTNPTPAIQGVAWSQINGLVTLSAPGSVAYIAENTSTLVQTPLGTANVTVSSGLARLSNAAPTASLPAGLYEVWGVFTPSSTSFTGSTSQRMVMRVVAPGSPVATTTSLSVVPAGVSAVGQGVALTATVGPQPMGEGTVTFRDGADVIGTATTSSGSANIIAWGLAPGLHSLTAEFAPTDANRAAGSTSAAVSHRVNSAPIAGDDSGYTTDQGVALDGTGLLANDSDADLDPLTAAVAAQPANGAVVVNPDGSFTYTPNPAFFGVDTFTYTASDDKGGTSAPATVSVRVRGRTTMVAAPVVLKITPLLLGLKLYLGTFEGRLTDSNGAPVPGQTVAFTMGAAGVRCTAVTDANGVAKCSAALLDAVLAILFPQTATFAGNTVWMGSSAKARLIA